MQGLVSKSLSTWFRNQRNGLKKNGVVVNASYNKKAKAQSHKQAELVEEYVLFYFYIYNNFLKLEVARILTKIFIYLIGLS